MIKKIGFTALIATSLIFGGAVTASAASVTESSPNVSYTTHVFQLGNGNWKEVDSNRLSNFFRTCYPLYEDNKKEEQEKKMDEEKEEAPSPSEDVKEENKQESNQQSEQVNKENNQPSQQKTEQKTEKETEQQNNDGQAQEPTPNEEVEQDQSAEDNQANASSQLSQYEQEVVDLTNQERQKHGLSSLKVDEELSRVAREKSNDMNKNSYFSHNSPTYGSPFDMIKSYGITYQTAGENIARGQRTPQEVVTGWMNSEGHRANILNGDFTHIGVGFVEQGNYWTQQFIGK